MIPDAVPVIRRTVPMWVTALVPLLLLGLLLAAIVRLTPTSMLTSTGAPPVERLIVERARLFADGIHLSVLNDGPDPVTIAQVAVDDAYWAFSSGRGTLPHLARTEILIPYPWVAGEAHHVRIVSSTGATFDHEIPVAVATPEPGWRAVATFSLIGLYVGVIPVALGLLWQPLLKRLSSTGIDVLLAVTIGLLAFLLVDAADEGLETAAGMAGSYQGVALFVASAIFAYLLLESLGAWLKRRRQASGAGAGAVLALLIAVGIGLHNFGEGLAIGAAFSLGEAALGTLLIIGFTLHNTTEGLAIVAPLARERPGLAQLATLGAIGGVPTVFGALAGGLLYSPVTSVVFLGFGAGAIAQVVLQIAKQVGAGGTLRHRFASAPIMLGLAAGFAVMYATGLLVG